MRSFDELEKLWAAAPKPPVGSGTLRGICLRLGSDAHEAASEGSLDRDDGLVGDRWTLSKDPGRASQLTLINSTVSELVAADHRPACDTGDNLHVELDLSEPALAIGARLRIGEALVQVTPEPHTGCKKFSARFGQDALRWVNGKERRPLRLRGVHCEVLEPGVVRVGDPIVVLED